MKKREKPKKRKCLWETQNHSRKLNIKECGVAPKKNRINFIEKHFSKSTEKEGESRTTIGFHDLGSEIQFTLNT